MTDLGTIDELFAGPRYHGSPSLKARIVFALKANGIETVAQLVQLSFHKLNKMPHLGPACVKEIKRTTEGLLLQRPVGLTSKIMEAAWRSILEQTIPAETHPDLVKTYKRFFYAGAKAMLDDLIYSDALDDGMEPTADDLQKIDAIVHEVNEFFCEVGAGRQ